MITTHPTRNCNVIYIDGLAYYGGRPQSAMLSLFTNKIPQYYYPTKQDREPGSPKFTKYNCGILLFALGSDHTGQKYAENFHDYIKKHKLGKVIVTNPVANPLHYDRESILYVWIPDWKKLGAWWESMPEEDRIRASKNQL